MTYFAPEESTFGVSFFDRLEANSKNVSLTQGPAFKDVINSIKSNISNILNSRTGGSESSPSLGLIDFNDATLDTLDLSLKIKLSIQDCLHHFEPRLKDIKVIAETDSINPFSLQFNITAKLNCDAIHNRVYISLLLDQNKQYRVF
jgi:type VI secretion system protein